MRARLVEHTRGLLAHAGFALSEVFRQRPISFDFLARRDDQLYILKVLTNIDSLSEDVAQEMLMLARFLNGRPLLVGLKSSSGSLEAGAVYVRHGIPILSLDGLKEYLLDGAPPVAFAAPGGFCVQLDGERLRELRSDRELSLGHLADVAGVSRRAISMYESGMSATIESALRLEEYLEEPLIVPLDPFARMIEQEGDGGPQMPDWRGVEDPFARAVFDILDSLGFGIVPTRRSPFTGIGLVNPAVYDPTSTSDALLFTTSHEPDRLARHRAVLSSISNISERTSVFIVTEQIDVPEGASVVERKELKGLEDVEALLELIKARRGD